MKFNSDYWYDWKDICGEFQEDIPEPDEILFAYYTYEDYEGNAFILGRRGNSYFIVEGGHCSCYGLEGQWNEELYDLSFLIAVLERRNGDSFLGQYLPEILVEMCKRNELPSNR